MNNNVKNEKYYFFGLILFLITELILFLGFIFANIYYKLYPIQDLDFVINASTSPLNEVDFNRGDLPLIKFDLTKYIDVWDWPLISTIILLLSNCSLVWARHMKLSIMNKTSQVEYETDLASSQDIVEIDYFNKVFIRTIKIAIVLGLLFLSIQVSEIYSISFRPCDNCYSSVFHYVNLIHILHVWFGIIWMIFVLKLNFTNNKFTKSDNQLLEFDLIYIYWNFVDIVWIIIFTSLYLI